MSEPLFDLHAADYEAQCMHGLGVSGESKEFFARGRLSFLAKFLQRTQILSPRRIVDYGCGLGDVTALLAETFPGSSTVGLDVSERCVERARRERASDTVSFATIGDDTASSNTLADLLHLNGVIHHVAPSQRPALLASLWRLIRPGGVLALFENNPLNPGTRIVMSRIPFDRDAQTVTAWGARRLLRSAGFQILETAYLFYFPRPLRALRPAERWLVKLPLGAQYGIVAIKPA